VILSSWRAARAEIDHISTNMRSDQPSGTICPLPALTRTIPGEQTDIRSGGGPVRWYSRVFRPREVTGTTDCRDVDIAGGVRSHVQGGRGPEAANCMDRKRLVRNPLTWILAGCCSMSSQPVFDDSRGYTQVSTSQALTQISSGNVSNAVIEDKEQQLRLDLKSPSPRTTATETRFHGQGHRPVPVRW